MDGLRKRPLTEARGFTERGEKVLLPDLTWLLGWRGEPLKLGEGCLAEAEAGDLALRTLDGVLRGLTFGGRLTGVCDRGATCGLKVLVEALKSRGTALSGPELDVGLELAARGGGPIAPSFWCPEPGLDD
jgi:hypothetical protein